MNTEQLIEQAITGIFRAALAAKRERRADINVEYASHVQSLTVTAFDIDIEFRTGNPAPRRLIDIYIYIDGRHNSTLEQSLQQLYGALERIRDPGYPRGNHGMSVDQLKIAAVNDIRDSAQARCVALALESFRNARIALPIDAGRRDIIAQASSDLSAALAYLRQTDE